MNTAVDDKPATALKPHARTPERWFLFGPDQAWCDRAHQTLTRQAESETEPSFLSWRLRHGLIRVVPINEVDAALTLALIAPNAAGVMRNATRIWAAMSETDWFAASVGCASLRAPSARGINVSLLSADGSSEAEDDLLEFLRAADAPDTLSRLFWLMNERPMPLPRNWLALAPLPERDAAQNAAMAEEGYRCYAAWAQGMLDAYGEDELRELWGPYPEDKSDEDPGEDESQAKGNNVINLDERRPPPVVYQPPSYRLGTAPVRSERLAASGNSGGAMDAVEPVAVIPLEPSVSRGAAVLEAFVLAPKSKELPVVIEFVASWTRSKNRPEQPEDLGLVLTLSKRKPVLIKSRVQDQPSTTAKDAVFSVRFEWPHDRRPADMPENWKLVGRWLSEQLPKARVSLH